MNDLIFKVIFAVVMLVVALIGRYVIPWLREKLEGTKLAEVITWAYKFVQAAEQTICGGVEKKDYVTKMLKKMLAAKKLALSDEQISALIEGIVNELYPRED